MIVKREESGAACLLSTGKDSHPFQTPVSEVSLSQLSLASTSSRAADIVTIEPGDIVLKKEDDVKFEDTNASIGILNTFVKIEDTKQGVKAEERLQLPCKKEQADDHIRVNTELASVKDEKDDSLKEGFIENVPIVEKDKSRLPSDADDGPPNPELKPGPAFQIALSEEQRRVVVRVKLGRSLFFTGSAGTGKSVVLHEIISWCRAHNRVLSVTASTGIAAVNIGGMSLHYWAGIGFGIGSAEWLAAKILAMEQVQRKRFLARETSEQREIREGREAAGHRTIYYAAYERWLYTDILIVDEISMINGNLFDKLEEMARRLRGNNLPFGGIQLVLAGDFFQLPPIWKAKYRRPKFAFEAKSWDWCVGKAMILGKVFRQKDEQFIAMLNFMRLAKMNRDIIDLLKSLSRKIAYSDGVEPVDVFANSADVVAENVRRLEALQGERQEYPAYDIPGTSKKGIPFDAVTVSRALEDCQAPAILNLKVGAKVMLIKNLVQGYLVNGTQGIVVDFISISEAQERQVPIASSDLREEHLTVKTSRKRRYISEERGRALLYPVVRFSHKTKSAMRVLCVPHAFDVDTLDGQTRLATRHQIPLDLAWALTIHKSQGQTIERLRVHLGRVFLPGQAYVALSRAVAMESLEVCDFNVKKITAHPVVVKWMDAQSSTKGDDHPPLPMPEGVQPVEPDGINSIVIYPEDLLHDPPPQPDDMPYSESYSEEDELWAQVGDLSLSDEDLTRLLDAAITRSKRRRSSPVREEDDIYWSQVEDIGYLLDGKLLGAIQ